MMLKVDINSPLPLIHQAQHRPSSKVLWWLCPQVWRGGYCSHVRGWRVGGIR